MSYTSIKKSTVDQALLDRVEAAVQKEVVAGDPQYADSVFGKAAKDFPPYGAQQLIWPVGIDYEDEYEFALGNNNPNPGGDVGVITDANISAAVQAHWPPDPEEPAP